MLSVQDVNILERRFLQSIIFQAQAIPAVTNICLESDFANEKYKNIYTAIKAIHSQNTEITEITEISLFKKMNELGYLCSAEDISLFTEGYPIDPPTVLAKLVKDNSIERSLKKITIDTTEQLNKPGDTLEIISILQDSLSSLSDRLVENEEKTWADNVDEAFEDFISTDELKNEVGIPTPYITLNKYINGGLKPGQLVTIGARPGIGKTVVSTSCAVEACRQGKSVLMFSLEMSKNEMLKRLTATHGNLLLKYLTPTKYKPTEIIERIKQAKEEMREWKMDIIDESDVTLDVIRATALQKKKTPDGLDFLIIDYLQLISTRGNKGRNRQEEVAEISRSCKILARQLNIPVMILVQVNRGNRNDEEDKMPSMEEIKESGAIAADSDIVLILHRKLRDDSADPKAYFLLDKNRGGQSGKRFQMRCVLEKNRFEDILEENTNENITEPNKENLRTLDDQISGDFTNEFVDNLDLDIEEDLFGDLGIDE